MDWFQRIEKDVIIQVKKVYFDFFFFLNLDFLGRNRVSIYRHGVDMSLNNRFGISHTIVLILKTKLLFMSHIQTNKQPSTSTMPLPRFLSYENRGKISSQRIQ